MEKCSEPRQNFESTYWFDKFLTIARKEENQRRQHSLKLLHTQYSKGKLKIESDGLLTVSQKVDGNELVKAIIVPTNMYPGLIQALHLKLNHPSKAQLQKVLVEGGVACKRVVGELPVLELLQQQEGIDACGRRQRGRGRCGRLLVDVDRHQVADRTPVVPVVEGNDGVVEQLVGPRYTCCARLVCPVVCRCWQGVAVHQDALRPKVRLA